MYNYVYVHVHIIDSYLRYVVLTSMETKILGTIVFFNPLVTNILTL